MMDCACRWYAINNVTHIESVAYIRSTDCHATRTMAHWAFVYISSGQRTFRLYDEDVFIQSGEFFILPPNIPHYGLLVDEHEAHYIHFYSKGKEIPPPKQIDAGQIYLPQHGKKPDIQLDSLSDVIAVLYQLNKKAGLRFEIDVKRPPYHDEWTCSLKFNGHDHDSEMNASLCLILENFRDEREKLETYWSDQAVFDLWIEKELAYYADAKLADREVEVLTTMERIQRRNELDRQMLEEMKKAAEGNGSQE